MFNSLKMKNVITTLFVAFWCICQAIGQNVGIGLPMPLDRLHVNGVTRTTGINLVGNSAIETGFGIVGKEINAGKIGYGLFTPNTLDIVGGGSSNLDRKIRFWAEGGSIFEGRATFNGNIGIGNFSPSQRLEVNGKIKIADDGNTSTAGTIRYNNILKDFEGFDGSVWQSFTKNSYNNWGKLSLIRSIITQSEVISSGVADAICITSDNYLALLFRASTAVPLATRFYRWENNSWTFLNQINEDLINTPKDVNDFNSYQVSVMTDDWLVSSNRINQTIKLYKRTGNIWAYHSVLSVTLGVGFGSHWDIDGNNLVISSPLAFENNGRVLYYKFNGVEWVFHQSFVSPFPSNDYKFGTGISIKNDYFTVGYGSASPGRFEIYKMNNGSFLKNSIIFQRGGTEIFYQGANVRISTAGGIYRVNTLGFWELIPNTSQFKNNNSGFATSNQGFGVSLYQNVNDSFIEISHIEDIFGEFGSAVLTPNCLIIPSPLGKYYRIYKKIGN